MMAVQLKKDKINENYASNAEYILFMHLTKNDQ